jgi:hypothetical protein
MRYHQELNQATGRRKDSEGGCVTANSAPEKKHTTPLQQALVARTSHVHQQAVEPHYWCCPSVCGVSMYQRIDKVSLTSVMSVMSVRPEMRVIRDECDKCDV